MTPERLFSLLNLLALAGWIPLIFLPKARWATAVMPVVVPALLAVGYVILVASPCPGPRAGSPPWRR